MADHWPAPGRASTDPALAGSAGATLPGSPVTATVPGCPATPPAQPGRPPAGSGTDRTAPAAASDRLAYLQETARLLWPPPAALRPRRPGPPVGWPPAPASPPAPPPAPGGLVSPAGGDASAPGLPLPASSGGLGADASLAGQRGGAEPKPEGTAVPPRHRPGPPDRQPASGGWFDRLASVPPDRGPSCGLDILSPRPSLAGDLAAAPPSSGRGSLITGTSGLVLSPDGPPAIPWRRLPPAPARWPGPVAGPPPRVARPPGTREP